MGDIDNTRDRLKLDNLEANTRKDLFNKFIDAGGEVINNKKKPAIIKSSSKKGSTATSLGSNSKNKSGTSYNKSSSSNTYNNKSKVNYSNASDKNNVGIFYNMKLWFNAVTSGVITTVGGNVNPKFLNFIDKNVIAALLEMDTLIFNALNPVESPNMDSKTKHNKIIAQFSNDLEDLELLERIKDQYNEKLYKSFLRPYKELNTNVFAESYVKEIKSIFKPLYILHNYASRIKLAGEKAMIAYAIVDNISKGIVSSRISAFKRAVDLIYFKYYPKLFALLQYASKEKLETFSDFNKYLNITEVDILGYYTKLRKDKEKLQEAQIQEAKENIGKNEAKEEDKLSKIEAIGIKFIDKCVSYQKKDNNIQYEMDPFFSVQTTDKIYRIKILIDFLDREYSAIFVSNKVKYNLIYDNQVRTDYKNDFNNIFLSLSDNNSRFNEYSDLCKSIAKFEEDKTMRFEQRVMMLSDKNGQRSYLAKNLKNNLISIITPFKKKLDKLLLDKEERERIIENPNDILTFAVDIGKSKKRIQGYNVMKALTEAYYFVSGLNYLITQGELSGAGILIEGSEYTDSNENIQITNDSDTNKDTKVSESQEHIMDDNSSNDEYINESSSIEDNADNIDSDNQIIEENEENNENISSDENYIDESIESEDSSEKDK